MPCSRNPCMNEASESISPGKPIFTCSKCGGHWAENYFPECRATITPPLNTKSGPPLATPQGPVLRPQETWERHGGPVPHASAGMTRRRKILTIIFLIPFLFGGLVAFDGAIAVAFVYWFILAVVFAALWFLIGPTHPAPHPQTDAVPTSSRAGQEPEKPTEAGQMSSLLETAEFNAAAKTDGWAVAYWIIFGFFLPATIHLSSGYSSGGSATANLLILLSCLISGILACRRWCRRRTYRTVLEKRSIADFFSRIYVPSLWSYAWRSFITLIGVGIAVGWMNSLGSLRPEEVIGRSVGVVLSIWLTGSAFALLVPFAIKRGITRVLRG